MNLLKGLGYRLSRRAERLFKLDLIYIVKGGLWNGLRFAVGIATSIATMIAFGNLLPRETYGIYSYLLSLGASLSFLTLSGIGPAVVRAVARGQENVVPAAFRLQLKYNLLAVATVGSAAVYYLYKGNTLFGFSLAMLAVAFPITEVFHLYAQVLTGRKRFDLLAKLTSAIGAVSALATIITLLMTDEVIILVAVFAAMSLASGMFAYWWTVRDLAQGEKTGEEAVSEMRRTAFHITGAGLIGTAAQYIDKIVLFQVAGPATLAVYGFAIAGPERLKGLLKNWISIALPKLAERTLDEISAVFYKRLMLSFLVGASMSAIYIILAPFIFKLFLPRYLDAILYSQVYAIGLLLIPALSYLGNVFYGQNMLRAIYISSTGAQLLRITLFVILGWRFGIWGLVAAHIASQALSLLHGIWIWEREGRRLRRKTPL